MGEANIFKMIQDFYLELENSSIRQLFPKNMIEASKKSAAFFVFLLGGPPLYQEKYGPPMMRKRHLPFVIDDQARQIWLSCFKKVLFEADKKYNFPSHHIDQFWQFLEQFSAWMVNTKHA
jgi:hemoglobin